MFGKKYTSDHHNKLEGNSNSLSKCACRGSRKASNNQLNLFLWLLYLIPQSVLRIQIRDPVPFWNLDPGCVKKSRSGSRMNIPDHISESLETIFWVKILKFFDADTDPESFWPWIRNGKTRSWIQDKHPGSATLTPVFKRLNQIQRVKLSREWDKKRLQTQKDSLTRWTFFEGLQIKLFPSTWNFLQVRRQF